MSNIKWSEKTARLNELTPFEHNPRTITESQFNKLKESLEQDGYHKRITVTHDMRVIGGHQRIQALRELGYKEVPVLVPDREMDDDQFLRIALRDNHNNGMWDMDILANFDLEFVRDIGLHDVMKIPPQGFMQEESPKEQERPNRTCPHCGELL